MKVVDLTCHLPEDKTQNLEIGWEDYKIEKTNIPLKSANTAYTGVVSRYTVGSMATSYIDLPGHIAETDDGKRADNIDAAEFYRVPCQVIHFNLPGQFGAVDAAMLEKQLGGKPTTPALIINALGFHSERDPGYPRRSVYLTMDAVKWLIDSGVRILVADIYESPALDGVFLELFKHGVATVCKPRHLHELPDKVLLTVAFPPMPDLEQIPCRVLAEF